MNVAGLIIALGGASLLALSLGGSGSETPGGSCPLPVTAAEVRAMAGRVEAVTGPWPGLGDYLVAVAYWESSHRDGQPSNACACESWHTQGQCKPNAARGLFQIRPVTADVPGTTANPEWLYEPAFAVATAAWLIWRLQQNRSPGRAADWLGIKRGWKLPRLVSDEWEEDPRSPKVRENFKRALQGSGIPTGFMFKRAIPAGMVWPGFETVLAAVRG